MNSSGCHTGVETPGARDTADTACTATSLGLALDGSPATRRPAQTLADALATLKQLGVTDRRVFDGILRSMLENNRHYLGFWSVWEPNALDGRDDEYVNQQGHDDTGRYIPFWNRGSGVIAVEPNVFYETPG